MNTRRSFLRTVFTTAAASIATLALPRRTAAKPQSQPESRTLESYGPFTEPHLYSLLKIRTYRHLEDMLDDLTDYATVKNHLVFADPEGGNVVRFYTYDRSSEKPATTWQISLENAERVMNPNRSHRISPDIALVLQRSLRTIQGRQVVAAAMYGAAQARRRQVAQG